jgi:hypothetical protein
MINIITRISLTALLVLSGWFSFFERLEYQRLFSEATSLRILASLSLIAVFFVLVGFYCKTLQRCLTLIRMENRKAKPRSVWFMFAIPFNFIEDFFIVINIANSIEEEKKSNKSLIGITDFGMVSGIGWSIAQIMSFIPNIVGQIAGALGLVLVVYHWIQISKINRLLYNKDATSLVM